MRTSFTPAQRADPDIRESEGILRACVHCGFCTATCPTYVLLGDERDSPRGRIYLIKDMLENDRPASREVVTHIDRCLSCLGCMTTCPSGVHYMHLVDHARRHIEETYRRPPADRLLRRMLAAVLPDPARFRLALRAARFARPLSALAPGRLKTLLALAPGRLPAASSLDRSRLVRAEGATRRRIALLAGCAQRVLAPEINDATIRLLKRHGCDVVIPPGGGCCGALTHHMGRVTDALDSVKANVAAWMHEIEGDGLDAIVVNASGCGTMVKDYGFLLRDDPEWAEGAARVSALCQDIAEFAAGLDLAITTDEERHGLTVAYHAACSLQHGQRVTAEPPALLSRAGFAVRTPSEAHLCCGSAGTYNMLQPEIAAALRDRKAAALAATAPDAIATGNIGCMVQIAQAIDIPIVHTAELLDWATGGPRPARIATRRGRGDS